MICVMPLIHPNYRNELGWKPSLTFEEGLKKDSGLVH